LQYRRVSFGTFRSEIRYLDMGRLKVSCLRLVVLAGIAGAVTGASSTASASVMLKWNGGVRIGGGMGLLGLACPTSSLCVGAAGGGRIVVSTKPTGGSSGWRLVDIAPGRDVSLTGIACPTVRLCVAVDSVGDILTSTTPTENRPWSVVYADSIRNDNGGSVLTGVSCPSESLCVAVDYNGNAITSTDPAGGAGAWALHQIDYGIDYECYHYGETGPACTPGLVAVSCASAVHCAAIDWAGGVLSTDDPAGDGSWGGGEQPASDSYDTLSCPSAEACFLTQLYSGQIFEQGQVREPSAVTLERSGVMTGVWCRTAGMCFAAGETNTNPYVSQLFESLNPTAASPVWKQAPNIEGDISAISCPTAKLCFAAEGGGLVLTGTAPPRHRR
jgi:hypothetical protein